MDFSSPARALESLRRRQPVLSAEDLQHVEILSNSSNSNQKDEWLSALTALGQSERWESLAVGLYIGTGWLTSSNSSTTTTTATTPRAAAVVVNQKVYMDGPRVPLITTTTTTTTSSENPQEHEQESSNNKDLSADHHYDIFDTVFLVRVAGVLHPLCLLHLEHPEPRVRTLVAQAVGACAARFVSNNDDTATSNGLAMVTELHERLAASIHQHLQVGRDEAAAAAAAAAPEQKEGGNDEKTKPPQYSRTSAGALDDTTGWRALETNWLCLAALVSGLREVYFDQFDFSSSTLRDDCAHSAITHLNRHVRAAAMQCLEQWITYAPTSSNAAAAAAKLCDVGETTITDSQVSLQSLVQRVLKTGLADNWSQVRMAASVLARAWFATTWGVASRGDDLFMAVVLPRMCLNRFYLAAGVKLYSHETWRLLFAGPGTAGGDTNAAAAPGTAGSGLAQLQQHLDAVVMYYVKMCDADNHAVREAACQAIAELAHRVPHLAPHVVETLLQALLMCFHDESWPVRDEACLACGTLCKAYPDACRGELATLWDRWTEQLTDQIWSVRADAAVAIGDAVSAFPTELVPKVREVVQKLLPSAREQPAQTEAEYKAHVNNVQDHSNTQLYSCGSLAPKLRKGGAGRIGCSSCGIDRPKAPWEATDGCLYLIRELVVRGCSDDSDDAKIMPMTDEELVPLYETMMDVCRVQHFPQSHELRATLWKCVPAMAVALGKDRFKRSYMERTVELLFWNLEMSTASQLSKHAAAECAERLADLVGKSIFRGRLDDFQQATYDQYVVGRTRLGGPPTEMDGGMLSPFGPRGLLVAGGGPPKPSGAAIAR